VHIYIAFPNIKVSYTEQLLVEKTTTQHREMAFSVVYEAVGCILVVVNNVYLTLLATKHCDLSLKLHK